MKRRNFLLSLAALPFVGLLSSTESDQTVELPLTFDKMTMYADKYQIFTPAEIMERWKYVSLPTGMEGNIPYCCHSRRLHVMQREEIMGTVGGRWRAQQVAASEIKCLGYTHILEVKFFESPIIGSTISEVYYGAYVRGATVKS